MAEITVYGPPPGSHAAFVSKTMRTFDQNEYFRQVHESDGFYVDPKTSLNYCFGITPYEFNPDDETDECVKLAKLAVHTFNRTKNTLQNIHGKLEFVKLLNATSEARGGHWFYLTFKAKNLYKDTTSTYQAIVWNDWSLKNSTDTVLAFRLEPTPGSMKTWFWDDHPYASVKKESGEGVSKVPEPPINVVIEEFVVDHDVGCHVIEDCLTQHIHQFTGASYGLRECKYDPSKKIIKLTGTFEQLEKARPVVCESIRRNENY